MRSTETDLKGTGPAPDLRWIEYYAEASRRRRARGWHRRRHDPQVRNPWHQRRLVMILGIVGMVAAVVVALVS
jgi:hypothetical protein